MASPTTAAGSAPVAAIAFELHTRLDDPWAILATSHEQQTSIEAELAKISATEDGFLELMRDGLTVER